MNKANVYIRKIKEKKKLQNFLSFHLEEVHKQETPRMLNSAPEKNRKWGYFNDNFCPACLGHGAI